MWLPTTNSFCLFCKRFPSEFTFKKSFEVCEENRKQIPRSLNNQAFLVYANLKFGNVTNSHGS